MLQYICKFEISTNIGINVNIDNLNLNMKIN